MNSTLTEPENVASSSSSKLITGERPTRSITIGVAGHTDHGKTTLTHMLTAKVSGETTNKKGPGVTVDISAVPYPVNDTIHAALIDVPGHHRYLKNTLRGLSTVDMVILVVAADDGVMPQTREHIELLTVFNIQYGCVVISKRDLVAPDLLDLAMEDVREALQSTPFKDKPLIPYSCITGIGLDEIKKQIKAEAHAIPDKPVTGPFHLFIDTVRQFKGFGTVVSGTALSGQISVDQPLYLFPKGTKTKARTLEVHHEKVTMVKAGQRVGVNLPKIPVEEVKTGMLLTERSLMPQVSFLNVRVFPLTEINDYQRIGLSLGTAFVKALYREIAPVGKDQTEGLFVQLKTEESLPCFVGNRFVLLRLDNKQIIGKGEILERSPLKYKRSKKAETFSYLKAVLDHRTEEMIRGYLTIYRHTPKTIEEISDYTGIDETEAARTIRLMVDSKEMILFEKGYYLKRAFEKAFEEILSLFRQILSSTPAINSLNRETLFSKFKHRLSKEVFSAVFSELLSQGALIETGTSTYTIRNFSITLSEDQTKMATQILAHADQSGLSPFTIKTLCDSQPGRVDRNRIKEILDFLCNENKIVRIETDKFISKTAIDHIKGRVCELIQSNGKMNLTDSVQILGYGRTKGACIFDYLDGIGFTCRVGNDRQLSQNPPI